MNVTVLLSSDKVPSSKFINIQETHL
jgi:hypothetical protein